VGEKATWRYSAKSAGVHSPRQEGEKFSCSGGLEVMGLGFRNPVMGLDPRNPESALELQWGTLEYHVKSLNNLQTAMHRTRKLCAVIVDTLGRECLANNQPNLDSPLRPIYGRKLSAQPRDKVLMPTLGIPLTPPGQQAAVIPMAKSTQSNI
jgi:hypothetical protein